MRDEPGRAMNNAMRITYWGVDKYPDILACAPVSNGSRCRMNYPATAR